MTQLTKRSLFDITKEHLLRYRQYKAAIERCIEKAEEIKARMEGIKGTDYSKDKVNCSLDGGLMENLVGELVQVEEKIRKLSNLCKDLERAIAELSEVERIIITRYYIEPMYRDKRTWIAIAFEVNFSERHCKRLRNEAIEKISTIFQ